MMATVGYGTMAPATFYGHAVSAIEIICGIEFDPCPARDFNGADFIYFANFQAFVDRAEWSFFRPDASFPTTRRRDIIYRGTIDPGERVIASLLHWLTWLSLISRLSRARPLIERHGTGNASRI
jgi:probable biosynthetic protein (TIGR04099 family)